MKTIAVNVKRDHIAALANSTRPIAAMAELVWNSLDADADHVAIRFTTNSLGGLESIHVKDNGNGIPYNEAEALFGSLGGSWKTNTARTAKGRSIHGKSGKGRFRAFSLGNYVDWNTTSGTNGITVSFSIKGRLDQIDAFHATDPISTDRAPGTEVVIANLYKDFKSLTSARAPQEFAQFFAVYLSEFPGISIEYQGIAVDPALARTRMDELELGEIILSDKVDFRRAHKRLGSQDALFQWKKGTQQSDILTAEQWKDVPAEITVRIIRFEAMIRGRKQRVLLVTTLLDPVAYPASKLIALYARRWNLELALRHLKTTMGMEHLRCQSPDMAEKEVLAYLVAYNLIRCLMAEAVALAGVEMDRASFKGTVDAVRQYTFSIAGARSQRKREELWDQLLANLARDLVPSRPGRKEPRAVKRRPKPFPLLNKPRHQYKDIPHRSRYRKNKPTKISRS